jgi:hypothetical protein
MRPRTKIVGLVCVIVLSGLALFFGGLVSTVLIRQYVSTTSTGVSHTWPRAKRVGAYYASFEEGLSGYNRCEDAQRRGKYFEEMVGAISGSISTCNDIFTETEVLAFLGPPDQTQPIFGGKEFYYFYGRSSPGDEYAVITIIDNKVRLVGYNSTEFLRQMQGRPPQTQPDGVETLGDNLSSKIKVRE